MVTTASPSPSPKDETTESEPQTIAEKGFFGQIVQSIFEPGANNAVILAMNVSFFLLLIVLFGLAFVTNWDFHVIMMLVLSTVFWAAMIWFVIEMQKVADRPDNMPPDQLAVPTGDGKVDETIATAIPETRKDR